MSRRTFDRIFMLFLFLVAVPIPVLLHFSLYEWRFVACPLLVSLILVVVFVLCRNNPLRWKFLRLFIAGICAGAFILSFLYFYFNPVYLPLGLVSILPAWLCKPSLLRSR